MEIETTNLNSNLDYFNLFENLKLLQTNLPSLIQTNIFKFDTPDEVYKLFTGNSNNLLIFFDKLNIIDRIKIIKYFDYILLSDKEKLDILQKIIKNITLYFNDKINSNNSSPINIYDFFNFLYNDINSEYIIIDFKLDFKLTGDLENNTIEIIKDLIFEWIFNLTNKLDTLYPKIFDNEINIFKNYYNEKWKAKLP
jgi:hypothetical protein